MWHNSKTDRAGDGHQRPVRSSTRRPAARAAIMLTGIAVLALAAATPALASGNAPGNVHHHSRPAVQLVAVTPSPDQVAGAGGVFNVDLALLARNSTGNGELSAANGYTPGINTKLGIGRPDPFAPGLVVLLSTTPRAAGGPDANLAGVFQLTDVASSHGLAQVFADWEVAKAGAFGTGTPTTLTAYLVSGTAPGIVTGSERPISNVIRETFTIGG
jgi:hypothetical protein